MGTIGIADFDIYKAAKERHTVKWSRGEETGNLRLAVKGLETCANGCNNTLPKRSYETELAEAKEKLDKNCTDCTFPYCRKEDRTSDRGR